VNPDAIVDLEGYSAPLMERLLLRQRAARARLGPDREAIRLLEQVLEQSAEAVSQAMQQREARVAACWALAGRWQRDALTPCTQGRNLVL
jgi:hypothetical protein